MKSQTGYLDVVGMKNSNSLQKNLFLFINSSNEIDIEICVIHIFLLMFCAHTTINRAKQTYDRSFLQKIYIS